MPIPEVDYTWTFTSSGTGTKIAGSVAREWTFHCECPAGSTAHVEIQAFRTDASTALGVVQGSSQTLNSSAGTGVVLGLTGPLAWVAPRCIAITSTGTLVVRAVAN
jgi:hypothetical protein